MQTYTVNFAELPPAAPVPSVDPAAVIPILTNNPAYSDIGVPFFEPFGSTTSFLDLDVSGADDAISFQFGNGGQVNYFPGPFPTGIDGAGIFHIDFYCENLDAGDNFRVVLLPQNTSFNMEYRVTVDETQPGVWQSFDIGLAGAGSGLPDEFTGADISNFTDIALIQIFPAEAGSTLGAEQVIVSNIYFYGGTLSTPDADLANSFAVAPNPSKDVWNIKAAANQNVTAVQVYDMLGKQVISIEPNSNEVTLNAADLRSGIYLARLSTANGSKTIKLVKN
jgi:hypothetical protein